MADDGIAYIVRYEGLPAPTDGFVRHYETTHAAILQKFPGLRGLTLMTPALWRDSEAVSAGQADFVAMMRFDDAGALSQALNSAARREAREDFAGFDLEGARVTHQAMRLNTVL